MAPGTNKKMKSRSSERFGIRIKKDGSKPAVELRLPGRKEKMWRVMDDLESAKRFVKLVCLYTDKEKAFPPDHPDLPYLEAFCKKEFEVFIWEEFQRQEATKLLQDSEDSVDHGNMVGLMMTICTPESSTVHFEVEPKSQSYDLPQEVGLGGDSRAGVICPEDSRQAGDVELNPWGLRPEPNHVQLQRMWREVERVKQEVERVKGQLADAMCAYNFLTPRGAREGFAPMVGNVELDASLAPNSFEGGPSHTTGSIASPGCDDVPATPDTLQFVEDILEWIE